MSRTITMNHTIENDELERFERALWSFLRSVRGSEPETHYQVYRLDDGRTFMHFATFPNSDALDRHMSAPYTRSFIDDLRKVAVSETAEIIEPIAS